MTPQLPPTLERLARANPVRPDDDRGRSDDAQAALARILAEQRPPRRRFASGRRSRRVLIIALAALLLAVGAGLATTDPFGIFRNPNPGSALFGVDSSRHVTPPSAYQIQCPETAGDGFRCGVALSGRRYELLDHAEPNGGIPLTRTNMEAAIRRARARGEISAATAERFDRDLAAVSDNFLARLGTMVRYSTLSTGSDRVPPPGVPELIVCEPSGANLSCQDLNGDANAAVGSGIYEAEPAPGWRPAPPQQPDNSWALVDAILGHPPTKAELRLMIDVLTTGSTASSSGSVKPSQATQVPTRQR